jgi:hypothetical protein
VEIGKNRISLRVSNQQEEVMEEFDLAAPVSGILPGDRVRVSVREESGRRIARQIEELSSRQ